MKNDQYALFARDMLRIRRVEEALAERYAEQEMRCPMHLCIGQEAVSVGVCCSLKSTDLVYSNHRAHGHYLAKGGALNALVAELYGRETGCCGGRGGSMHLIDHSVGFMGATPIVGGTIPLAVGSAWASALRETGQVSVVFFGDGCFEEGVVHESFNFSALHKLPIVFVCENNDFSVYTRRNERQPERAIHAVAAGHGLAAFSGDGNDVSAVAEQTRLAVARARNGEGPQFLEWSVYRWREHCGPNFDHELEYRTADEVQQGSNACPIERSLADMRATGEDVEAWLEKTEAAIRQEIEAAFQFALESPIPSSKDEEAQVYAN